MTLLPNATIRYADEARPPVGEGVWRPTMARENTMRIAAIELAGSRKTTLRDATPSLGSRALGSSRTRTQWRLIALFLKGTCGPCGSTDGWSA